MTYTAPLKDIRFTLDHIVKLGDLADTGAFADLSPDLVDAILEEAGKLTAEVIGPLNWSGNLEGATRHDDGSVTAPRGFKEAYQHWIDGGWGGVPFDPAFGGQGLPRTLMCAVQEMVQGANPSFGLCPLLTQGAIEALSAHGTDEQKALYLEKLISGTWTGTMCLTESHAGSDVGALRARAERQDDGTYKITGTKIYITWGEHDVAENIIHLVLARLPDAPPGTRGISLFLVPKFLVNAGGSPGARNDVGCVGIEHKLGIHGSPTCTMAFGENGGATGYLIGKENRGMACMFTMMNNARLNVGIQGVGVSEAAVQKAGAFALERLQGKPFGLQHEPIGMIPIIQHPDVRRMLFTMRSQTQAIRAICYATAKATDTAHSHPNEEVRRQAKAREELLTPVAKAFSTDLSVEIASLGIQVHGGMGFVEETGAAQYYRDARIFPIYEGTNGIQAQDLVLRKIPLEGGAVAAAFFDEIRASIRSLAAAGDGHLSVIGDALRESLASLSAATTHMLETVGAHPADVLAGATPYLRLFGIVAGGHYLAIGALAAAERLNAGDTDTDYLTARIVTARFYAETVLPLSQGLAQSTTRGSELMYELSPETLGLGIN